MDSGCVELRADDGIEKERPVHVNQHEPGAFWFVCCLTYLVVSSSVYNVSSSYYDDGLKSKTELIMILEKEVFISCFRAAAAGTNACLGVIQTENGLVTGHNFVSVPRVRQVFLTEPAQRKAEVLIRVNLKHSVTGTLDGQRSAARVGPGFLRPDMILPECIDRFLKPAPPDGFLFIGIVLKGAKAGVLRMLKVGRTEDADAQTGQRRAFRFRLDICVQDQEAICINDPADMYPQKRAIGQSSQGQIGSDLHAVRGFLHVEGIHPWKQIPQMEAIPFCTESDIVVGRCTPDVPFWRRCQPLLILVACWTAARRSTVCWA